MRWDAGPRTVLAGLVRDLRQAWWSLLVTDLAAKALVVIAVTPAVALVLRWFLARGAGAAAVTDESILFFALTPLGIITLVVVGSLSITASLASLAATMTIAMAAQAGRVVGPVAAIRFVAGQAHRLAVLTGRGLLRLSVLASPFLAAAGGTYLLLLTRYDINYYLAVHPPEFWVAAVLAGLFLAVGAFLVIRRLLRWTFAMPILLYERAMPGAALAESTERTRSRLRPLAGWAAGWAGSGALVAALVTGAVGVAGRILIPSASAGLARVAAGVAAVVVISAVLNVVVAAALSMVLAVLVGRLYASALPAARDLVLPTAGDGPPLRPAARAGWVVLMAAAAGVIAVAVMAVNDSRADHTARVTAHRGAEHEAPENTLPAFRRAIELEADGVELDVQLTADGHVVLLHDADFRRVAGSPLRPGAATLAGLRAIDVGSGFGPGFAGEPPATLAEVLDLCRGRVQVTIELKYYGSDPELIGRVIELVDQRDMGDQIVIMSFNHRAIAEARARRPDLRMGFLVAVAVGNVLTLDADFYAVPASLATRRFVRAAHRRGREVYVWGVDDPLLVSAMVSRGVDELITPSPDMARRVLVERQTLGPVERLLIDVAGDLGIVRLPDTAVAAGEA